MQKLFALVGILFLCLVFCSGASAQSSNTFPLSGNVGIGTATPSYPLTVNGSAAIGDILYGVSEISSIPLLNKYIGTTADAAVNYILTSYTKTATGSFAGSGFDGLIYLYRGGPGAWNGATEYDVAIKNAYDNYSVAQFNSYGHLSSSKVVTLTYKGTSYTAVQVPIASSMDVYMTGRYWGFVPLVVSSSDVSGVTPLASTYVQTNTDGSVGFSGNVGIGTTTPTHKLDVMGQMYTSGGIVFPDGKIQNTAFDTILCGGDYAESVDVSGEKKNYEPGDVLVIDPQQMGRPSKGK